MLLNGHREVLCELVNGYMEVLCVLVNGYMDVMWCWLFDIWRYYVCW